MTQPMSRLSHPPRKWIHYILVPFSYLLAAGWITWPMLKAPFTTAWGRQFDLWNNLWLFWHMKKILLAGDFSSHTRLVLYPAGNDLFTAFGHFLIPLVSVPFQGLLGLTGTYNFFLLAMLFLAGLGVYLLLRHLGASMPAAWLAGFLFLANRSTYAEWSMGSLEMAPVFWFPFYILALMLLRETGKARYLVAGGGLLALAALSNWLFGGLLVLFSVLYVLWHLRSEGKWNWPFLLRTTLAGLLALMLVLPMAWALARHYQGPERHLRTSDFSNENLNLYRDLWYGDGLDRPLDPEEMKTLAAVAVLDSSVILANLLIPRDELHFSTLAIPSLLVTVLGVAALVLLGRRGLFWGVTAAIFLILAMGPVFLTDSPELTPGQISHPLPFYYLYNWLPGFSLFGRPYRFQLLMVLAVCVLIGMAVDRVRNRWLPGRWARAILVGLIVGAVMVEPHFLPPVGSRPLADTRVPEFYRQLADSPGQGAMIEIPFLPVPLGNYNAAWQYYQSAHGRPLFNCSCVRLAQLLRYQNLIAENGFLKALQDLQEGASPQSIRISRADLEQTLESGFTTIVVHQNQGYLPRMNQNPPLSEIMIGPQVIDFLEWLLGPPTTYPGQALVFDLQKFRDRFQSSAEEPLLYPVSGAGNQSSPGGVIRIEPGEGNLIPIIIQGGSKWKSEAALAFPPDVVKGVPVKVQVWLQARREGAPAPGETGIPLELGLEYHQGDKIGRSWAAITPPADGTWTMFMIPAAEFRPPLPPELDFEPGWLLLKTPRSGKFTIYLNSVFLDYNP